uniref:EpsG family protein n=1 Tax=uncultured Bacteroides sp. TaxID=162156 RepID=UPI00280B3B5F|nr:EpsG family protein [uncultured Bacteroides sp.]
MMYLIILLLLLYGIFKYDINGYRTGQKLFYFVFLVLVLMSAFRYRIGIDTMRYMDYHKDIYNYSFSQYIVHGFEQTRYQPLWIVYELLIGTISENFFFFQFVHSLIINCVIFIFIKKYTRRRFVFLYLYYILFYFDLNFEILREGLAVCCFLLGFKYYLNHNWTKYYICAVTAFFIHISAVIMIIFPLFYVVKINKYTVALLVVSFCFLFFNIDLIKQYMVLFYITDSLESAGEHYINSELYGSYEGNLFAYLYKLLPAAVIPLCWIIFFKNKTQGLLQSKMQGLVFLYIILGTITAVIPFFSRFSNYLVFILILFYSLSFWLYMQEEKSQVKKIFVTCTFLITVTFFPVYKFLTPIPILESATWSSRYYPYYSIFFPEKDKDREYLYYMNY